MESRESVLLTICIATADQQWFAAGINSSADVTPLIQSEPGDLDQYVGISFDEQVSYLRHRLSGVLQRGSDRLWGMNQKAEQIIFVADGNYRDAPAELTHRVAEHFVEWIAKPPVTYFICPNGFLSNTNLLLKHVAGEIEKSQLASLESGLPKIFEAIGQSDLWEVAPRKRLS